MEVQVHINKLWGLIDISLGYCSICSMREFSFCLVKDFMNFQQSIFVICLFLPAKNFVIDDLFSTSSDIFAILNLLMEYAVVKFHQNEFLEFANERKVVFREDTSRNNHCYKRLVLNFDELFDQIYLLRNQTILKQNNVIVSVHLSHKLFSWYDSNLAL